MKEIKQTLSNKINIKKAEYQNNVKIREQVKELLKEKKYEEIYTLYGKDFYIQNVPQKYLKKDIKQLLEKGMFEEIYTKYGPVIYGKYIPKMKAIDIYLETGKKGKSKRANIISRLSYNIKKRILCTISAGMLFFDGVPLLLAASCSNEIKKNAVTYAEDISFYDKKINEYAKKFENLDLNHLQIIMKVMDDMWNSIAGYGDAKVDIFGFNRLAFLEDNEYGVCRHIADDFAAKINVINPDYNARTIAVYMEEIPMAIANITIKRQPKEETIDGIELNDNQENNKFLDMREIIGNHKVVLMDIPDENIILMVDPTSPSIGVFRNGSIYSFATSDGKLLKPKYLGETLDGVKSFTEYKGTFIESFFDNRVDIETLREKYGVEEQNKALEYVRNLNTKKEINIQKTYYNSSEPVYELNKVKRK